MAQPLPQTEYPDENGIDAAASRLETSFRRLEAAARRSREGYASLNADREKLNGLLQEAELEIHIMKETVKTVSARIDATIATLETMQA